MVAVKGKSGIYPRTDKMRKAISEGHKGLIPWNKGKKLKPLTEEHKRKIREAVPKGKDCYLWRGGISKTKQKRWRKKNWDKVLFLNRRWRVKRRGAEGFHTQGEWELLKKQYGYTCPACKRKEPKIKLTEDHIIPLSKGGSDYIENIQPLCRSCNSRKHAKTIKYHQPKYDY